MINIILKTIIVYFFVVLTMRLLGKKQAGQLQPHELVITLIIAEIASVPLGDPETPIIYGIAPAVTLMLMYSLINAASMRFSLVRRMFCGQPSILICDGVVMAQELRRLEYSMWNLLEQLRIAGNTDISSIHYAILETNGQLSVLANTGSSDENSRSNDSYITMIINGAIHRAGLCALCLSKNAVFVILRKLGYSKKKKVYLFMLTSDGNYFLQDVYGNVKNGRTHFPSTNE